MLLIVYHSKMEYEQFFSNDDSCNCYDKVKIACVSISCFVVLLECLYSCKMRSKIDKLKIENNTLKTIILKTIDKSLTNVLKNGYELDNSDDE